MNFIARNALAGAIRLLIGNNWWAKVREAVEQMASTDLSGDEKRAIAYTTLKEGGWVMAGWLLNLAIEIAVAVLLKAATNLDQRD